MAKLSAHGHEILRLEQERDIPASEDSLCNWERKTRSYMSDGKILEKWDVRFRPDSLDTANGRPNGRLHSYGWKITAKLKTGFAMEQHAAKVLRALALLTIPLPPKPETQTNLTLASA